MLSGGWRCSEFDSKAAATVSGNVVSIHRQSTQQGDGLIKTTPGPGPYSKAGKQIHRHQSPNFTTAECTNNHCPLNVPSHASPVIIHSGNITNSNSVSDALGDAIGTWAARVSAGSREGTGLQVSSNRGSPPCPRPSSSSLACGPPSTTSAASQEGAIRRSGGLTSIPCRAAACNTARVACQLR